MVSKFAATQSLPPIFAKKTTPFKDPELSVDNIKKMVKQEFKAEVVFKVAIDDNDTKDYNIKLNDLGQPLNKYTARSILVAYKLGGKCKYKAVMLQRPHLGGGKYGPLELVNLAGEPIEVNCAAINQ